MDKTIDEVIEERLNGDTDFQASIKDLSDEEKTSSIESKRKELLADEFKSLNAKASEADKHKKAYEDQKVRNEKAEGELKKYKQKGNDNEHGLSIKDTVAIQRSNVHEEDIDDVLDYAKFKGISVGEALKSPIMQNTLNQKTEFRKTAAASQVKPTRQTSGKSDDGAILDKTMNAKSEADIPEPGSPEAMAVFRARHNLKE